MAKLVFLSTLFMLLSITLFEGLIVILTTYTLYLILRGQLKTFGRLFYPILLYAVPTLTSTILFTPSQLGKGIERSVFLLVYPLGGKERLGYESFKRLNLLLIGAGLFLIPVVLYRFYKTGQPAPLWGGWFEVGVLYSFFSLSALGMFLYTKKKLYLFLFLVFTGFVFFSMRRSAMLALVLTLFLIGYILRGAVGKRILFLVLFSLIFASVLTFGFLTQRDARFFVAWEVISGKRSPDEQALNTVSSARWQILKAGLEVVHKDLREGHYIPLLVGHGVNSGYYLEPKSPVGGVYESVFLVSELIEKGVLGLLGILWLWWNYYSFLIRFKVRNKEDFLLIPSLSFLSVLLVGSVFTFFWDAMLPWILLVLRTAQKYIEES